MTWDVVEWLFPKSRSNNAAANLRLFKLLGIVSRGNTPAASTVTLPWQWLNGHDSAVGSRSRVTVTPVSGEPVTFAPCDGHGHGWPSSRHGVPVAVTVTGAGPLRLALPAWAELPPSLSQASWTAAVGSALQLELLIASVDWAVPYRPTINNYTSESVLTFKFTSNSGWGTSFVPEMGEWTDKWNKKG